MAGRPTYDELMQRVKELELESAGHKLAAEEFRNIYDAITDFMAVIDTDFRIVNYNKKIESHFGNDLEGQPCYQIYQKRNDICPNCAAQQVLATGKPARTCHIPNKDLPALEKNAYPVFDENGEVTSLVIQSRDISDKLKLENELRANEKKLRDITAALGEGVLVSDKEGIITFVNPEGNRLLGWEEGELLGKMLPEAVHCLSPGGRQLPSEECPAMKTIQMGIPHRVTEEIFDRKNGETFPVSLIATPIREGHEVIGSVTVFQDISEQLRAREALVVSEEKYRTITTTAKDAIFHVGRRRENLFLEPCGGEDIRLFKRRGAGQRPSPVSCARGRSHNLQNLQ